VPRSSAVVRTVGNPLVKRNLSNKQLGCVTQALQSEHSRDGVPHDPCEAAVSWSENLARKVNGFWVEVCQGVLISESVLVENPIDCRIFFADNTRRKTESGIGGKNP